MAALVLQQFAAQPVDIQRVLRMLLVHDLGEIDVGDTIVYQVLSAAEKLAERAGVQRIINLLPASMRCDYLALWDEFEAEQSADAKFAKALDRALPLIHNMLDGGRGWKVNAIHRHQVEAINKHRILAGCPALWEYIEPLLDDAQRQGYFDHSDHSDHNDTHSSKR